MTRIPQNRCIALFSLWSFNQSEARNKKCRNIYLIQRSFKKNNEKIIFIIAIFHKFGLERSFKY